MPSNNNSNTSVYNDHPSFNGSFDEADWSRASGDFDVQAKCDSRAERSDDQACIIPKPIMILSDCTGAAV